AFPRQPAKAKPLSRWLRSWSSRAVTSGSGNHLCVAVRSLTEILEHRLCDEAVSALDVSVQAQVINLLKDLQKEFHLTYLFISHDLSVVEHISNKVGVMYLGRMVEYAPTDALFSKPLHPYTEALLSAVPIPDPTVQTDRIPLKGEIPNPANPPSGCYFHERCSHCCEKCCNEVPAYQEAEPGHFVACHRAEELTLRGFDYK
ncbi:MAG: ABC transporter ATP-binding protein, partial [Clostridia bacterium]|nr:ABC transporter ATP-binding protein [Clostridia bacterium]MBR4537454.1 ABC transporter ATP-binding protein [Clostridia bacterium]